MRVIDWNTLLDLYKAQGNTERFQLKVIKELSPLTNMFIKQSRIDTQYQGELKSYLWYGYFRAFETYGNANVQIQTWVSCIARNRIKDFYKKINRQSRMFSELLIDIPIEEEQEDNSMNELLVSKMLDDAGIVGIDADVYKLKKGILENKQLNNASICKLMGIRRKTLRRINNRNAKAMTKYKKENQEE